MEILIDVDGTISKYNQTLYLAICNRKLKLGIDEELLSNMNTSDFFALPEVTAYRTRIGEQRYQWNLQLLGLDPELQRQMDIIDGAIEGTHYLEQMGVLGYCTARKTIWHERLNEAMARATRYWLKVNGFPHHQDTVFVTGPLEKLRYCATHIEETGEEIILIDDSYEHLLGSANELPEEQHDLLRKHLTLWAFGAKELKLPEDTPLRALSFPAWNQVEQMLASYPSLSKSALSRLGSEGFL